MQIQFWGTRGSIPVAMTSAEVRRKLIAALTRASGRRFETPEQAAEIARLQKRLHEGGMVAMVLMILALIGMALSHPI